MGSLVDKLKRGIKMLFGLNEIKEFLSIRPAISDEMYNAILTWTQMYEGRAAWIKSPTPDDPARVVSLGLPALISSEKARMATLEMESEITAPMVDMEAPNPDYQPPGFDEETGMYSFGKGSKTVTESVPTGPTERADFLNSQYQKVLKQVRTQLEYACAKGGIVIKPYVVMFDDGATPDEMFGSDTTAQDLQTEDTQSTASGAQPAPQDNKSKDDLTKQQETDKPDEDKDDKLNNDLTNNDTPENKDPNLDVDKEEQKENDDLTNKDSGNVGHVSDEAIENAESDATSSKEPLPKYEFEFDFVQADRFFPMAFDSNGKITEAAFVQTKVDKDKVYTRLEYHKLEGRSCTVQNFAFESNNSKYPDTRSIYNSDFKFGKEIPLTDVPEWANLAPIVTIENVDRPLFAYLKMPEANTIDTYSPIGVSCFSRVVELIRDADEQYSRLLWEYEGGELAIDVDRDALRPTEEGTKLPTKQQRLFRKVDLNSEETYEVFSPALRDVSLINGLNTILTRIEDATGLSRGTISSAEYSDARTATELKILKQRSYQTNKDIQDALRDALETTVYVMDVYCDLYGITSEGKYEISFEFDDSILTDSDVELDKRMKLLNAGITSKEEVRMWYFGETENQAKEALMKIDDEKKTSMETNIVNQQQLGEQAQGQDFSGDNNNPGDEGDKAVNNDNKLVQNS